MFKTLIRVIKNPEVFIYGLEKIGLLDWMQDEQYLKLIYRLTFKRRLNLSNAEAFTEKIAWYKIHWRNNLAKECTDKLRVKEYVTDKIGPEYVVDNYGSWESFDEIDFNKLPDEFVLKSTCGTGDTVICKNKDTFDFLKAKKMLCKYCKRHFSSKTKEWAYYNLPYRIIADRLIKREDGGAIFDYKFFCFYGKPEFLLVGSDRDTSVKFSYFDMDWNFIPVKCGYTGNPNVQKPKHFDEMVTVASKLSEDFPHVRVDLYEEEGRVYFGELTFYHYGGITRFEPDKWDYKFGGFFDLSKIPKDQLI